MRNDIYKMIFIENKYLGKHKNYNLELPEKRHFEIDIYSCHKEKSVWAI